MRSARSVAPGGFVVFRASGLRYQLAVQVPVASALAVALFVAWVVVTRRTFWSDEPGEPLGIFLAALVWNPLIFIPVHFLTQGYVSTLANVVALMLFQIPVNAESPRLVQILHSVGTPAHS